MLQDRTGGGDMGQGRGLLEGGRGGRNNGVGCDVFSAKTLAVIKTRKWKWTEEKKQYDILCRERGETRLKTLC